MSGQQRDHFRVFLFRGFFGLVFFLFFSGVTGHRGIKHLADCSALWAGQGEQGTQPGKGARSCA